MIECERVIEWRRSMVGLGIVICFLSLDSSMKVLEDSEEF